MDASQKVMELSRGYQSAVVLLTACHEGVFAAMGRSEWTAEDLARTLSMDGRALETVLLALAANGIVDCRDGRFRIAETYAPVLLPGEPDSQTYILNHGYNCMRRWTRLDEVLRSGLPVADTADVSGRDLSDFIRGMADASRTACVEIAEKVDFSGYRRMLDLGGGPATASIVYARRWPRLECVVFDLPGAIAIAREEIVRAGMAQRIATREADYFVDDFGEGFDLVYISNIIHSMGPDGTAMLARKAHAALAPGGAIMIREFFLDDNRASPLHAALFSVNMLVGTLRGRTYTVAETREILDQAGFADFHLTPLAGASGLLTARRRP